LSFNVTDQLLIRFFCIRQILEKKRECNETVHQPFIVFKKTYDSQLGGKYCTIFS
jgi:hypothetical protein